MSNPTILNNYENDFWHQGIAVIGVDEAGRGPLAGPVVAAAVQFIPEKVPPGIRDSKKLSENQREKLAPLIKSQAIQFGIGIIHEQEIDKKNILQATFLAMRQAMGQMDLKSQRILVDGKFVIPNQAGNQTAIVDGDDKSISIAGASILAKTTRDDMMRSYHLLFPEYGFDKHKGYGAAQHMEALREFGRCPIHRRSFRPISDTPNTRFRLQQNAQRAGWLGEIYAGMQYIRSGYQLLAHSYHGSRDGEIDLIALKAGEVVFIEVKSYLRPAEAEPAHYRVTPAKQKTIAETAEHFYANESYRTKYPAEPESRFDIVTVDFSNRKPKLTQFADAFLPY